MKPTNAPQIPNKICFFVIFFSLIRVGHNLYTPTLQRNIKHKTKQKSVRLCAHIRCYLVSANTFEETGSYGTYLTPEDML